MKGSIAVTCFVALVALAPVALAPVYKCQDEDGRTTYADAPCGKGGGRVAVPEGEKASLASATVCTQLLDETQRLAVEAERDARRGRPKNAANERRRQKLVTQYEQRCAAIRRSSR